MSRAPRATGAELVSALAKGGFRIVRIRGSHYFLGHQDGRRTVVPVHVGETIGSGLLSRIGRDCQVTMEELENLLRGR